MDEATSARASNVVKQGVKNIVVRVRTFHLPPLALCACPAQIIGVLYDMCWFLTSLQNLAQATNFCFTPIWQANGNLNGLRQAGAGVQPPVSLPALCDPIGPAPNLVYPTSCPSGTVTLAGLPEVSIGSTLIVFMQGFHCVCVARDRSIIPY